MENEKKAVAIVSGGLDSVVLAHLLKAEGYRLHLLSFDYGQRHKKELLFANLCAIRLGARHDVINLSSLGPLLKGSALTDREIGVPDGYYTEPAMGITVVPNRNAVMLSMAYAVAVADQAEVVAIGVHSGDHAIYPDCRANFILSFHDMERLATQGYSHPDLRIYAPFVLCTKYEVVRMGHDLQVPFAQTWSCYKGGHLHCSRCGTCCERREAFALAGVEDPTRYEIEEEGTF